VASFGAFYDANVLYPAELRNFLMRLAMTGLFRANWSAHVHEEWISKLLENRPDLNREKLQRTRALMDLYAPDALVTGYEDLIEGLKLPDPNDRHVLAAAIRARSAVIVTMNLKDFPAEKLASFGIEAQHPDEFVSHLLDLSTEAVVEAARLHRASLKNPPKSAEEYLEVLHRQELKRTVAALKNHVL
jgi:predicted nucleic acid-binding protein